MRRLLALVPLVLATACGAGLHSGKPAHATSEALVAVALSHLTPEPYSIDYREQGAPIDDMGTQDPSLGGLLRWKPDPDWTLDVQVQPVPKDLPSCEERGCVPLGDADLTWQEGSEDAPPALVVSVVRDGELRSVGYEGGMEGDPRTSLLPFDLMELEEIVTDPAFSLETTTSAVEAGEQLARDGVHGSRVKATRLHEPPPAPATTPRSLAAAVQQVFVAQGSPHLIRSGRPDLFAEPAGTVSPTAVGLALELEHGLTLHVTMLDSTDRALSSCQPSLRCWRFDGSVLVGREGLSGVLSRAEDHTVHAWLEGPGVHAVSQGWFLGEDFAEPASVSQGLAMRVAALDGENGAAGVEGIAPETTPELVAAGKKLAWFHD